MGSRPDVVVLDYGFGNIRSAQRALERAGAAVEVTSDSERAMRCDGLVVPGVGAFAACMDGLDAVDGGEVIRARVAADAPVLGICVGAQILFAAGTEHGVRRAGVGLLSGEVERLTAPVLPHMGWNTVLADPRSMLLKGVDADERFYFVHSYAAIATNPDAIVGHTTHGADFIATVERGSLSACQFHPEKSADAGHHLLSNWMETL